MQIPEWLCDEAMDRGPPQGGKAVGDTDPLYVGEFPSVV